MTRKLKILYHHRVAAQDGQSVHIKELTAAFADLGHELVFIGPSLRPKEFGSENKLLAFVRRILPRFAQELLELLYGYRAYAKLMRAYKDHKPDILYERHNLFLPAGRLLKKRTSIPYLLEVNAPLAEERAKHSGLSLKALGAKTEADCWRAADMNFPVSDILANHLRKAGVEEHHIQVLHNGINHKDYEEANGKEIRRAYNLDGKIVLGFTGFLRDWHRLDNIIQMIAKYEEEKSPHLLVVGDGPAVSACKALAAELGIENRVHFAGFQPREAIPHFLAAMDIALQPAVTAYASPLKVFEYMRAGLAIAAPDQPNIREILKDGSTALLFDPENPDAREKAIQRLIEDTALRKNLGTAACAEIDRGQYTWRANAERIAAIAAELLERNP